MNIRNDKLFGLGVYSSYVVYCSHVTSKSCRYIKQGITGASYYFCNPGSKSKFVKL